MKFVTHCMILLCLVASSAAAHQMDQENHGGDYVVILHGIARSAASMDKLADHIEQAGFTPINIPYPSTQMPIKMLSKQVNNHLRLHLTDKSKKVHYVGYSMGSLIVRVLLQDYRPENLGRVVMLAPPNQGSEVADFLMKNANGLYRYFYGPAGAELGLDWKEVGNIQQKADYPLGIIAGDRSIDPASSLVIPGPDDGKVGVHNTKLDGMHDHITIHATHTFIMKNDKAISQTIHFLKNGTFSSK